MRVGRLPHLINLKLGQVGPGDVGEAGGGHVPGPGWSVAGEGELGDGPGAAAPGLGGHRRADPGVSGDEFPRHCPTHQLLCNAW